LVGGDQRVVGAIAHVGVGRELRLHAAPLGHLGHVLAIVHAGRVEGGRDHRHQELHPAQTDRGGRARVGGLEGTARDLGHGGVLDDAVGDRAARLEATPFHLHVPPLVGRERYWARKPPSMARTWPVTIAEAREARKRTAPTISSGSARRPIGVIASMRLTRSGLSVMPRISGVRTQVGAMAFTRMPWLAHSTASARVMLTTAPFVAWYEMLG